ncbi:hypothetical protein HMPREF2137_08210 [Hoylesella buccalis DNF00853]|uniref:Uncharacterized protein n=2 Tax=Hoylesella buccalis TaxID=28127 RepID=A0A096BMM3_9BACT|nr:hypothetical protein HMPREF2137_08210 [Hoylesella buccalis DNF00853]
MEDAANEQTEPSTSDQNTDGEGATSDVPAAQTDTPTDTSAVGATRTTAKRPAGSSENLSWQRMNTPRDNAVRKNHSPTTGTGNEQSHKRGGFFRSCFFLFFVILLVLVLTVRSCWKSARTDRLDSSSLADDNTEYRLDQEHDVSSSHAEVDPFEEIHPGKAPSWIQGTWTYGTDYGVIKLTINDKKITESIGDETVSGTFYYENRRLVCDFGDPNNITIYRLDTERQQIDAGNGMLMEKEP